MAAEPQESPKKKSETKNGRSKELIKQLEEARDRSKEILEKASDKTRHLMTDWFKSLDKRLHKSSIEAQERQERLEKKLDEIIKLLNNQSNDASP